MKQLLLLLSLLPATALPMGTWASKLGAFGKKALPKLTTAGYMGAITYPFWTIAAKQISELDKEKEESFVPAQCITDFVKKELAAVGIHKEISVRMSGTHGEGNAGTDGRTVYVGFGKDGGSKLEELIIQQEQRPNKDVEEQLAWYRALIQHEGNHIAAHDRERKIAVLVGAPAITHGIYSGVNKLLFSSAAKGCLGKYIAKPLILGGALMATKAVCVAHAKQREYCADDRVQNDPFLLETAIKHFKEHEKEESDTFLAKNPGTSYQELSSFPYSFFYAIHHGSHPVPLKRVQRFEARLKKLEQEKN